MDNLNGTVSDDGQPKLALTSPPNGHSAENTALHGDSTGGASNANAQVVAFHEYIIAPNTPPSTTLDTTGGAQPLPGMELTNRDPIGEQSSTHNNGTINPPDKSIFQFATYAQVTDAADMLHNSHAQTTTLREKNLPDISLAVQQTTNSQPFPTSNPTNERVAAPAKIAPPLIQTPTQVVASAENSAAPQAYKPTGDAPVTAVAANAPAPQPFGPVVADNSAAPKPPTFQFASFDGVTRAAATVASKPAIDAPVSAVATNAPVAQPFAQTFVPVVADNSAAPKPPTFQFASFDGVTRAAATVATPAATPGDAPARIAPPLIQTPTQVVASAENSAAPQPYKPTGDAPVTAVAANAPAPQPFVPVVADNSAAPKPPTFQFASFDGVTRAAATVATPTATPGDAPARIAPPLIQTPTQVVASAENSAAPQPYKPTGDAPVYALATNAPVAQPFAQTFVPVVADNSAAPRTTTDSILARNAVTSSSVEGTSAKAQPVTFAAYNNTIADVTAAPANTVKPQIFPLDHITATTTTSIEQAGTVIGTAIAAKKPVENASGVEADKTVEIGKTTEDGKAADISKNLEPLNSALIGTTKAAIGATLLGEHPNLIVGPDGKMIEATTKGAIKLSPIEIAAIDLEPSTKSDNKVVVRFGDILISTVKSGKMSGKDEKEKEDELTTSAKIVATGSGLSGNGPSGAIGTSGQAGQSTDPSQASVSAIIIDPTTGLPISIAQSGQNSLPGLQLMDGEKPIKSDKSEKSDSSVRIDVSSADGIIAGVADSTDSDDMTKAEKHMPESDDRSLIVSTPRGEKAPLKAEENIKGGRKNQVKDPDEKDLGDALQALIDGARSKFGKREPGQVDSGESRYDPEKTRRHMIEEGETLESIAEMLFDDEDLAGLLYEINSGFWKSRKKKGKITLEFGAGATIFLPTKKEIEAYRLRMRQLGEKRLHFEYLTQSTTSLRQVLQANQKQTKPGSPECSCEVMQSQTETTDLPQQSENTPSRTTANLATTGSPTMYFSSEVLRISKPLNNNNNNGNHQTTGQLQARHLQSITRHFVADLKEQLANIELNSRIVIDSDSRPEKEMTYFNARVEYCHQGHWATVIEYQVNADFAILLAYKGDGKKQKVDLNLPMEVLREMAETDLQNNRLEYCRKFILGRRILA
ncbi:MAG: hypothetical protein KGS72_04925 [Cyanobacteria bacterium REEB67]|nr:hypothetical protein [Cyanobacteria bacterium REEB67]